MRRTWVKLYVEQLLRGSIISELTPEQRWIFIGLILLAGDSPIPGIVYQRKDENGNPKGYPDAILADHLGVSTDAVAPALARMKDKNKVTIDSLNVISITNWSKYQSEYERTRNAPSRVVQKYGLDVDVDVDRDVDIEVEKTISFDASSRRWENITATDMEAWAKAYPACDINSEIAKAGEWIIANPQKGKKSNYRRFIVNWLSRSQDRGGSVPSRRPEHRPDAGLPSRDVYREAYERRRNADGKKGDE